MARTAQVKIRTGEGMIGVSAYIDGEFAYHRPLVGGTFGNRTLNLSAWTVSHIPSGLCMAAASGYRTLRDCRRRGALLSALPIDWSTDGPAITEQVLAADLRTTIRSIMSNGVLA